jgi:glucose/arabinose dehydrogenase
MVVSSGGDLLANLQNAGRTSVVAGIKSSQAALRDNDKNGRADLVQHFGTAGGTGIGLYKDYLYVDAGRAIVRYKIDWNNLSPTGRVDTVVTAIPGPPGHQARNFVIAPDGTMYVNFGSPSNACQEKDRSAASKGTDPCRELDTRAGIWRFSADKLNQRPSAANRFATGLRNSVALRLGPGGQLYSIVQGRDQLFGNWSEKFTEQQNAELPAEIFVAINEGDDFGWPYCYYDGLRNVSVLAPEYGGDGKITGRCTTKKNPLVGLPAHWSPIDMLFYTGTQFPAKYRNGVFATFHGSWNRAPLPQAGYNVVFIPMINGQPSANFEVIADNFTPILDPAKATHRPAGLAQGTDGSIYISDDVGGRIYKLTYSGAR